MIVETDFLTHWKTRLLTRLCNDPAAPLMILRLWSHCQNRKTWVFDGMSDNVLAAVCGWSGDPHQLRQHLHEAGFIDEPPGAATVTVHDWDVVNASLIRNWVNGRRGGRPSVSKEPSRNPAGTQRKPIDKVDRRDECSVEDSNTHSHEVLSLPDLRERFPNVDLDAELAKAGRHCRTKYGRDSVDLEWFAREWLPKAGPQIAVGRPARASAAAQAEPDGWREWLNVECPGNAYAEGGVGAEKPWAEMDPAVQRFIADGMAKTRSAQA